MEPIVAENMSRDTSREFKNVVLDSVMAMQGMAVYA
jgi:hypothetical protein